MCTREDLARSAPDELAGLAEDAIGALARSGDPAAFGHLLQLTRTTGEIGAGGADAGEAQLVVRCRGMPQEPPGSWTVAVPLTVRRG